MSNHSTFRWEDLIPPEKRSIQILSLVMLLYFLPILGYIEYVNHQEVDHRITEIDGLSLAERRAKEWSADAELVHIEVEPVIIWGNCYASTITYEFVSHDPLTGNITAMTVYVYDDLSVYSKVWDEGPGCANTTDDLAIKGWKIDCREAFMIATFDWEIRKFLIDVKSRLEDMYLVKEGDIPVWKLSWDGGFYSYAKVVINAVTGEVLYDETFYGDIHGMREICCYPIIAILSLILLLYFYRAPPKMTAITAGYLLYLTFSGLFWILYSSSTFILLTAIFLTLLFYKIYVGRKKEVLRPFKNPFQLSLLTIFAVSPLFLTTFFVSVTFQPYSSVIILPFLLTNFAFIILLYIFQRSEERREEEMEPYQ